MRRSILFSSALCFGLFLSGFPNGYAAEDEELTLNQRLRDQLGKPNIILILADDLGYGDLGCYGQEQIQTPNLDRLAAEGMRFTQCYAGSTVCAPSRACLMTGRHTGHARIRGNGRVPLLPEDVTVAEVLAGADYESGVIGKWGLGLQETTGVPQKQGFSQWLGYLDQTHAHNYYPEFLWRYDSLHGERLVPFPENADGRQGRYSHDVFTLAALNYVRVNRHRPFFLYLAYTIPHANPALGRETGNGMQVPDDAPYTDRDWPQPEKNKAAMITRMDADIGRLVDLLKELKIDDNTLIFFTSDNGPLNVGGVDPEFFRSSGPLRGVKRDLYEGGIRVPMIVRWPGRIAAGQVSDQVWAAWDFLPTVAQLAGASHPRGLDGISIAPTLLGGEQERQHEFLYWEFHERGFQQAVRMGDWKAVRPYVAEPLELYNLKEDPGEEHNVAGANPEIVGQIEEYLENARTESEHWPVKASPRTE
ncbi:MAG TPA: arylsulfatase [Methylomirabilota bacterium]|nr:arylsulfatase [Methylomirabilota bacterium]